MLHQDVYKRQSLSFRCRPPPTSLAAETVQPDRENTGLGLPAVSYTHLAPIQAVFFSSAAGRTVDAVEVWGNAVPYLSGVDSPEGEEVPNYHSTASVPVEEFKRTLLAKVPQADLSGPPSGWFGDTVRNSAGGVSSVTVGGAAVTGSALRELFSLLSLIHI